MKKLSKCCNATVHKQTIGNYFCSNCISICNIKYNFKSITSKILTLILIFINISCKAPYAVYLKTNKKVEYTKEVLNDYYKVNSLKVEIIESNGNTMAISLKDAKGLMQITSICLDDYNKQNNTNYTENNLFNPKINKKIANWYIGIRIPNLLKEQGLKVNVQNILICYNGGINSCINFNKTGKLNTETQDYLNRYFKQI